jgi:hypothetical protein
MIAKKIKGATHYPGAPKDWDLQRDGPCGALPVRMVEPSDGRSSYCESAWVPTAEEIAALNAGKPVILRVVGWQVPVAMYVGDENAEEWIN